MGSALIGAGAVLGQVVAGLATKPLAAAIGTDNLILVWAGTLAAAAAAGRRLAAGGETARPAAREAQGLRYVRRSSLLGWMAVGTVLASLLFFSPRCACCARGSPTGTSASRGEDRESRGAA